MRVRVQLIQNFHIDFAVVKLFNRDRHVLAVIQQRVRISRQLRRIGLVKNTNTRWRVWEKQSDQFVEFNLWQFGRVHGGGQMEVSWVALGLCHVLSIHNRQNFFVTQMSNVDRGLNLSRPIQNGVDKVVEQPSQLIGFD